MYLIMLEFIARNFHLSMLNCFTAFVQNPNLSIIATAKQWKKLNLGIKQDARAYAIQKPFDAIDFVFDISDTQGAGTLFGNEMLFKNQREFCNDFTDKLIKYYRDKSIKIRPNILMSIDGMASPDQDGYGNIQLNVRLDEKRKFVTLVHEIAHIRLGHVVVKASHPSKLEHIKNINEITAESVAYLVCKRFGIEIKSFEYIKDHIVTNVPKEVSISNILLLATEIEKVLKVKYFD